MSSGIYRILNTVNGKQYIGSAANFRTRWTKHTVLLNKGTHHSRHLQGAWNKYGVDAFVFEELITCANSTLIHYEQQFIDQWKPEYNICPTAGSALGIKRSQETCNKLSKANTGKTHSAETRRKISEVQIGTTRGPHTQETKTKMSAAAKGRPRSAETLARMSEVQKGKTHSDETRAKMSTAAKGKPKSHDAKCNMAAAQQKYFSEHPGVREKQYIYKGIIKTAKEWSKELGITPGTFRSRMFAHRDEPDKVFYK